MAKQTHLLNRKGHYYFRIAIPQDLQPRFGKRELGASLKTTNYKDASLKCAILSGEVNKLFEIIKSDMTLTAEKIKGLSRELFATYIQVPDIQQKIAKKGYPFSSAMVEMQGGIANKRLDLMAQGKERPHTSLEIHRILDERTLKVIQAHQLDIQEDSLEYAQLKNGISRCLREWEHYLQQRLTGALEIEPKDEWFKDLYPHQQAAADAVAAKDVTPQSDTISVVVEKYLAESSAKSKNQQKTKTGAEWFVAWFGDMPIHEINKATAREFKENLILMPNNAKKRFPNQSVSELIKQKHDDASKLSITTLNAYLGAMVAAYNWAINNYEITDKNPFKGLSLKQSTHNVDKRNPFSDKQLKDFFSSPIYLGCKSKGRRLAGGKILIKDSKYWVPLFSLFTGARLNEICQLELKDVYQEQDVWLIDINANGMNKSVKNSTSTRQVPIHSKLISLGFLEYLKMQQDKGEQRLFSDISLGSDGIYSTNFSKAFNREIGVLKIKTDKTSFHSFRHRFIDELRRLDTPDSTLKAIVGHTDASVTSQYGSGYSISQKQAAIDAVQYSCIDWEKIK